MNNNNADSPAANPSEADIRERAYYLWLERGCPPDRDQEMWFAAKLLLHDRTHRPPPSSRETLALHQSDPQHQYHDPGIAQDARPTVARSGRMQRIRAHEKKN